MVSLEISLQITLTVVSSITIIIGIWHIILPYARKWFDYMPEAPDDIKDSIEATNFFFSLFLIMLGTFTIYLSFWQWSNTAIVKFFLLSMSILLLARIVFQIVKIKLSKRSNQQFIILSTFFAIFLLYSIPTLLIFIKL